MSHHVKTLSKEEIDKLYRYIKKGIPDLHALEENEMATLSHIGYLYVLDSITIKELSGFWGISKNSVRKRLKAKIKAKSRLLKRANKCQRALIKLTPGDAFPDIEDYVNFLNWRSEFKQEDGIAIPEAAMILGIHRATIYRYINNGELHTCGADENKIMRFSFNVLVQKIILETEIKLNVLRDYIFRQRRSLNA